MKKPKPPLAIPPKHTNYSPKRERKDARLLKAHYEKQQQEKTDGKV